MNILEKIVEIKRKYLSLKKSKFPIDFLEKSRFFKRDTFSLQKQISRKSIGIIAEIKRKSPSRGLLKYFNFSVEKIIIDYKHAGVIAVSILTDFPAFKGREQDLIRARQVIQLPLLYKDIIIDEYQIILAKSIGSDIILLIAEILSKKKIKTFIQTARSLNLEVLMELHSENEIFKINNELNFIGVNNRDLKTFSVNLSKSVELSKKISMKYKISESGISDINQINFLYKKGFDGFLIGENFMCNEDPGRICNFFTKKTIK